MNTTHVFFSDRKHYRQDMLSNISDSDLKRAQTYTHTHRKELFLLGRYMLSKALLTLTGSRHYELHYANNGKPLLVQPVGWHFNITHTGDSIIVAVTKSGAVGIDAELLTPRDFTRLSKKIFSAEQHKKVSTSAQPTSDFYHYWTQHEALIKLHGLSVFNDTDRLCSHATSTYTTAGIMFSIAHQNPNEKCKFYSLVCDDITPASNISEYITT